MILTLQQMINNDFYQVNKSAFQWKTSFNPDSSKQAQEVIFSRKTKKISHSSLRFKNSIVSQTLYQKHLSIFIDAQLTFQEHLKVNYQGKQNYRTVAEIAKSFAKIAINDYIQSFCETTSRLW